jgi:hypothetical protein
MIIWHYFSSSVQNNLVVAYHREQDISPIYISGTEWLLEDGFMTGRNITVNIFLPVI